MDMFKPGVEGIVVLFSDNEGNVVYEFPMYHALKEELEPLLLEVSVAVGYSPKRGSCARDVGQQACTSTPC
jgi:hypothetical protein